MVVAPRGHLSGWLDAKSFDLNGPGMYIQIFALDVFGLPNFQIEDFNVGSHLNAKSYDLNDPWMLIEIFDLDVFEFKNVQIQIFIIQESSVGSAVH